MAKQAESKAGLAFGIFLIFMALVLVGTIILMILMAVVWAVVEDSTADVNTNENANTNTTYAITDENVNLNLNTTKSIEEISASVVNIFCPFDTEPFDYYYSEGYSGSGTILDHEGLIITNSHVIPQDLDYLYTHEEGCFVTLPDPYTGQPDEIYLAHPWVYPGLSDDYDIAFLDIYDVYTDPYDGYTYGTYPNTFPAFDDSDVCTDEYIKLGEDIHVFGYPASSGNYSLTVTEGIVSNFPGDGTILTSAKIDSGNSGGLAVDTNGCMIGIPSAVSLGNYENLGVLISVDLIYEFIEQAEAYLAE